MSKSNFSLELEASNKDYQDKIIVTDENKNKLNPSNITFNNSNGQGNMPIVITVNEDTEYRLLVVYEEENLDNSLKSLKVDGQTIQIENNKYEYIIKIANNTSSAKIEAILKDEKNFKFTDEFGGIQIIQTPSSSTSYPIIIEPKNSTTGASGVTYTIKLVKENNGQNNNGTNNSNNSNNNQNINSNPTTGDISMYVMILVLMASLICSIVIYQKKLEQ